MKTLSNSAEEVEVGTFLATKIYGDRALPADPPEFRGTDPDDTGYDDDYRAYLDSLERPWTLVSAAQLGDAFDGDAIGRFTNGGLYRGISVDPFGPDREQAEGLLAETTIGGQRALVLAFRGTDAEDAAVLDAQTFSALGNKKMYEAHRPLLEAALQYAADQGIDKIVVSGHSLGGTMVDVFALVDAARFEAAGIDLTMVSLASPGVDPDLSDAVGYGTSLDARYVTTGPIGPVIVGAPTNYGITHLTQPENYIGINHTEDRVGYPAQNLLDILGFVPNLTLVTNLRFGGAFDLDMPGVDNSDVHYGGAIPHGFGAEHNGQIYNHNISAITSSPLVQYLTDAHGITLGVGQYSIGGGSSTPMFGYAGPGPNDEGERTLYGTERPDFLLGLEGSDAIFGFGGSDLVDGGPGDDLLNGMGGNDFIYGGEGQDLLSGGIGNDILQLGSGDIGLGGPQNDIYFAVSGTRSITIIDDEGDNQLFLSRPIQTYNAEIMGPDLGLRHPGHAPIVISGYFDDTARAGASADTMRMHWRPCWPVRRPARSCLPPPQRNGPTGMFRPAPSGTLPVTIWCPAIC